MQKIISIVIATYNAEKTIKRCLDSIVYQKTNEIELVIVDGASTDHTLDIIRDYSSLIDVLISEKDNGVYDAWNKALKLVTGKYIQFLGADDFYLDNSLIEYVNYALSLSHDVSIVSAQSRYVDITGKLLMIRGERYSWKKLKKNMCLSHGSILHNRNLFTKNGLFDISYRICADYELLVRNGEFLDVVFYPTPVIQMQGGGLSFSYLCQWETFRIRKTHKTVAMLYNYYLLFRGCVGLAVKKMRWNV
ncbi:glycosyltransferase family 2 protein [Phocaeicola dorei]|uniref:Glycosyltransferase 2-like domain-containing protein n=2 Tax=Phocaeicola dorei TaxID=357276 RepID=B6W4K7_9BACT|nr:glycosyltransferase family 2 protein [Phocaeicola dorei]EEB23104.1 glycosyltransferase, group 2 family protein [Phocaeicola dorei DSM 17855]QJR76543.1 glycosyltransferase [Phocaeicola dorei]UWN81299.1 glycosyltransferase [Phocaeicola dorei]